MEVLYIMGRTLKIDVDRGRHFDCVSFTRTVEVLQKIEDAAYSSRVSLYLCESRNRRGNEFTHRQAARTSRL